MGFTNKCGSNPVINVGCGCSTQKEMKPIYDNFDPMLQHKRFMSPPRPSVRLRATNPTVKTVKRASEVKPLMPSMDITPVHVHQAPENTALSKFSKYGLIVLVASIGCYIYKTQNHSK